MYGLSLRVFFLNLEPSVVGLLDDVVHVLSLQGRQYSEEEPSIRELTRELFLSGQVLGKLRVSHGIRIDVLDRELIVERYLKMNYLIGLECELLLLEDVFHEGDACTRQGWKKYSN